MQWNYLDNNATTQPAPEVVAAMQEVNEHLWANPSSVHRFGQAVRQRIDLARVSLASLIHCHDRELVFTSGGTESNQLALRGVLDHAIFPKTHKSKKPPHGLLVTTRTEHSAILKPAQYLAQFGVNVVYLPMDRYGRVAPNDLADTLKEHAVDGGLCLVSIQWANNETGIIQPIEKLVEVCHAYRADQNHPRTRLLFHTDATQAIGKIPVNIETVPVDLLTLSGHKFHGPKGVGALYVRSGVRLQPQHHGGSQERERRGGTENTPGIVGLGVAVDLAAAFLSDHNRIDQLTTLRDHFEQTISDHLPSTVIHSKASGGGDDCRDLDAPAVGFDHTAPARLWNTSNLGFPGLEAEAILVGLSERGVCVSAGAACSSGSLEPSPVLIAMGIPEPTAHGSVRFSICRFTTRPQVEQAIRRVIEVVGKLAKTMPLGIQAGSGFTDVC